MMQKILMTITAILTLFILSCSAPVKKEENKTTEKWSIKMAEAVMHRYDTLAYYNGRTRAGWSYDVSLLGAAIYKLGDVDQKYSDYLKIFIDMLVDKNGNIERYDMEKYNIDLIRPATCLQILANDTGEEKYKKAIPQFIEQMEKHPKTETGGFWHKKRYPWQIWLDGVYMAAPFLSQYATENNQPQWHSVVTHEILLAYEKTVDPETGLLYHAWDESKEQRWSNPNTGQSPHFWSRAMGWYVMAIVDVLDFLPEDHPDRPALIETLNKTLEALLKVRDPEKGVWHQVLDMGRAEGNYLEGSGTAMYIYAMAKGAKKGYLAKSYLDIANAAFNDMVDTFIITDEDGLISMVNICGSCGLGGNPYRDGSYDYYINEKIVKNDTKGVGPFILAAIELNR
ncbi:glycoside hydrolase family 88 protein [uncultured Draconibacterium sp.]|mgnify:CR=1 FL=1|uniref:glycoside hydrolase family 88/105 protein n=1 Tax=uncultured Draconibacterium sp. TaxID=1573823 RepID=UPI0025DA5A84|nr:glycoside hydrolase family 88 protein [uncultured Draconibacterium sp.]